MTKDSVSLGEIYKAVMSQDDFKRLSTFIYREYGIKMPEIKKTMLQSRLHKRLRELSMISYSDYVDYLFSKEGQQTEVIHMIDMVSTNKTDFFREPAHFDFLHSDILPELLIGERPNRFIKIWSAGCSSGEEPYTIAMSMSEFAQQKLGLSFDFSIFATDISTRMLKMGVEAIYKEQRVEMLPLNLKKQYFLRSKDRSNPTVRVIPELRRKINFQRLNFMDNHYNVPENYDIIFCRNVLIYFDRETQEKVINKLCTKLKPNGFFFLGHSESITNFDVPLRQLKPTIFRKIN
jgi:Methylase of chemotaxis methyl-accepting proteins